MSTGTGGDDPNDLFYNGKDAIWGFGEAKFRKIMDLMDCREYILTFPMVEECQPFDEDIVVYKICGRWFATIIFSRPDTIAVKCNPDRAILLRDEYSAITPAWHFNKRHWNDLNVRMLPDDVVRSIILSVFKTGA